MAGAFKPSLLTEVSHILNDSRLYGTPPVSCLFDGAAGLYSSNTSAYFYSNNYVDITIDAIFNVWQHTDTVNNYCDQMMAWKWNGTSFDTTAYCTAKKTSGLNKWNKTFTNMPGGRWKLGITSTAGGVIDDEWFFEYVGPTINFVRNVSNIIPIMTSVSSPSGTVTASGDSTGYKWKAFNGTLADANDAWIIAGTAGWLAYQFSSRVVVNSYIVTPRRDNTNQAPRFWTFEGYNGTNWIVLNTQSNISSWVNGTAKTFTFTNNYSYIAYRINITSNNGNASYLSIGELEMTGSSIDPDTFLVKNGEASDADVITLRSGSIVSLEKTALQLTSNDFSNYGSMIISLTPPVISQLNSKFEIIVSTPVKKTYSCDKISGTKENKLMLASGDIDLTSAQCVNSVALTSTVSGTSYVKVIVSIDSGSTWRAFDGTEWLYVNPVISDVKTYGMTKTVINAITKAQWIILYGEIPEKIRFGYLLDQTLSTETCNCDLISINIDMLGMWKLGIPGSEYNMFMTGRDGDALKIDLLSSGDWKINY